MARVLLQVPVPIPQMDIMGTDTQATMKMAALSAAMAMGVL